MMVATTENGKHRHGHTQAERGSNTHQMIYSSLPPSPTIKMSQRQQDKKKKTDDSELKNKTKQKWHGTREIRNKQKENTRALPTHTVVGKERRKKKRKPTETRKMRSVWQSTMTNSRSND
jgi:hypothetical protein